MSEPIPTNDFLFFKPSQWREKYYRPTLYVVAVVAFLQTIFGPHFGLFLSPYAYRSSTVVVLVGSLAVTLLFLNAYWAYEGNYTHWKKRPSEFFKNGSMLRCVRQQCLAAFFSAVFLGVYFYEIIPRALLSTTGKLGVHELVVEEKSPLGSWGRRSSNCRTRVVARSSEYRRDNLCLKSNELYAEINVGDILIVEGKANWIGLLVDKPIALRDADTGLERSVQSMFGQRRLAQIDAIWVTP